MRTRSIPAHLAVAVAVATVLLWPPTPIAAVESSPSLRQLGDGSLELQVLSQVYTLDREYRSMKGPWSKVTLDLLPEEALQLVWIVAYRAEMVGPDGFEPLPSQYMCHSNLDMDPIAHQDIFGWGKSLTSRLFTLSQGQLNIDLPDGFGIPFESGEELELTTQVLDLNWDGEERQVRHKVTLRFFRDSDLKRPMRPLFAKGVYGLKLLDGKDGYFGLQEEADEEEHGPGCLAGENADDDTYEDGLGRTFTGHWVVAPGREVSHTLVTEILHLAFDTRIHYAAVHLHPFAESIELRDLTTGESVLSSKARSFDDRVGLAHVESFSSPEGIPLFKDHEYELVSVYDNTSSVPQDSMAVLNLYMADRSYSGPNER